MELTLWIAKKDRKSANELMIMLRSWMDIRAATQAKNSSTSSVESSAPGGTRCCHSSFLSKNTLAQVGIQLIKRCSFTFVSFNILTKCIIKLGNSFECIVIPVITILRTPPPPFALYYVKLYILFSEHFMCIPALFFDEGFKFWWQQGEISLHQFFQVHKPQVTKPGTSKSFF